MQKVSHTNHTHSISLYISESISFVNPKHWNNQRVQEKNMEGGDNVDMGGASGAPSSSRWNPTKEQISMLESLYRQGIRTPSAEQIQQITGRLRAYGHIEGKNVFYWFQNHKARQRQKQKQESMAYINRYFHTTQSVFPAPCPNGLSLSLFQLMQYCTFASFLVCVFINLIL